ncbi:hypothetical protein F5Y09DRAFT_314583 [Xylaria sp. FL1042]|nr:hypothetical protein F5Y09DRAFT_314583 [Xylaria sp. FL1042]
MAKSLMKLLAIPALLAGIAHGLPTKRTEPSPYCIFTTSVPTNATYQVGDEFVLTWDPTGLPAGTLDLQVESALVTPIIIGYGINIFGQKVPIYDYKGGYKKIGSPNLEDKTFTWTVEVIANSTGAEYQYYLSGTYTTSHNSDGSISSDDCSTPTFHVSA